MSETQKRADTLASGQGKAELDAFLDAVRKTPVKTSSSEAG